MTIAIIMILIPSLIISIDYLERGMHISILHIDERELDLSGEQKFYFNSEHYDNLRTPTKRIKHACIQSEFVRDKYLKLFIVYHIQLDPLIAAANKISIDQMNESSSQDNEIVKMNKFIKIFQIFLDEKPLQGLEWMNHKHISTNESGLMSFIPIEHLSKGKHVLRISIHFEGSKEISTEFDKENYAYIPFWIE